MIFLSRYLLNYKKYSRSIKYLIFLKYIKYLYFKKVLNFKVNQLFFFKKSSLGRSKGCICVRGKRSVGHKYINNHFLIKQLNLGTIINTTSCSGKSYKKLGAVLGNRNIIQYIPINWDCFVGQKVYNVLNSRISHKFQISKSKSKFFGNFCALRYIPVGSNISHIESTPGRGAVFVKSPGCVAKLLVKKKYRNHSYAGIQLPSKKTIYVKLQCVALIGRSFMGYKTKKHISAGFSFHCGRRPKVRGIVMNPVDHPHGGGEGKKSNPSTPRHPWGTQNKWKKTLSRYTLKKRQRFLNKIKYKSKNIV